MSNGLQLTKAQLQDLERIASISDGALSIDDLYDAVNHIVRRLIHNDGLILNLLDPNKSKYTVAVRTATDLPPIPVPLVTLVRRPVLA